MPEKVLDEFKTVIAGYNPLNETSTNTFHMIRLKGPNFGRFEYIKANPDDPYSLLERFLARLQR